MVTMDERNKQVKVEVFGLRDDPATGLCQCSGDCGKGRTFAEMFNSLVDSFAQQKDLAVEFSLYDVIEDDLSNYPQVYGMFKQGLSLPIIAINGKVRFYGGIDRELIASEIVKLSS
jgi:hypothetical protein